MFSKLKFRSHVIYWLECANCGIYGQTLQWVKNRVALHKSDITRKMNRCALVVHAVTHSHEINWESLKILDTENNGNKN